MGFLDKIKRKINQGDDDLDELDSDSEFGEEGGDEPSSSSGGGALGRAAGLLNRVKKLSSSGDDDEGGRIGGLLGKVKRLGGGMKNSGDSDLDDDTALDELDTPDADQDDEDGERPIRRSGIAAKLDGDPGAAEPSKKEDDDVGAGSPVPAAAGFAGLDLDSLFEQELVVNPMLRDLADSLDDVSAVELAADLRTFLEELQ